MITKLKLIVIIIPLSFALVIPPRYTVELACGFGATVFLVVVLIVVYHVYWLEMVLFYRAHFGTDETILGEYRAYDANLLYHHL